MSTLIFPFSISSSFHLPRHLAVIICLFFRSTYIRVLQLHVITRKGAPERSLGVHRFFGSLERQLERRPGPQGDWVHRRRLLRDGLPASARRSKHVLY